MRGRTARQVPIAVHVSHTATWLGMAATIYSGVIGQWWWLAAAVITLVASLGNAAVRGVALLVALVLGAWPAAAVAVVSLLASLLTSARTSAVLRHPLNVNGLLRALDALPPAERRAIEREANNVDSMAIVRAAVTDDPSRWPFTVTDLDGAGYDGANDAYVTLTAQQALTSLLGFVSAAV